MENQQPMHLLKSETGLPANILDVCYYFTAEFGMMIYVDVQNNTEEELNDKNSFSLFFTEEADDFFYTPGEPNSLSEEDFNKMKDYVKRSYADKDSLLAKLFEQCKQEWEAANPDTVAILNSLGKSKKSSK